MVRKAALIFAAGAAVLAAGCTPKPSAPPSGGGAPGLHAAVNAAAREWSSQKTFDPWVLTSPMTVADVPAYSGNGNVGIALSPDGTAKEMHAGGYRGGALGAATAQETYVKGTAVTLDMRTGQLTGVGPSQSRPAADWQNIWKTSDIEIDGDPEAQQVTHANMFYLLSSTEKNGKDSVPPMGLSSPIYSGHIFWDAEIWMFPALVVQHPDYAKSIINYRYRLLGQADANAKAHGFAGAEYPWESADTGKEEAPGEFAQERHITADIAIAAWNYYLWTGDKAYLKSEGWPIIQQTALYWISRLTMGTDGKYHIKGVMGPDETAGTVDDDAYTNAAAACNLRAAAYAADPAGQTADPKWLTVADQIYLPYDGTQQIYTEVPGAVAPNYKAKQADAQLLIYPLGVEMPNQVAQSTLAFWAAHTIGTGPAMTSSINSIIASRLGDASTGLSYFQDSYRPFERTGLCAFSEKRTTDRVYFHTGMGGCLQAVLYGFMGLNAAGPGVSGRGRAIASSGDTALYADPHLPPSWSGLTVHGVSFRGKTYTLTAGSGNSLTVKADSRP